MIEPRRSFHIMLQKRDSHDFHSFYVTDSGDCSEAEEQQRIVLEHDEPDIPIHPALEYEIVPAAIQPADVTTTPCRRKRRQRRRAVILCDWKLMSSFLLLVLFGAGNAISLKLQAIPMYNYPNFLNLFCNFIYIPICFAYIIPAAIRTRWGRARQPSDLDQEEEQLTSTIPEEINPASRQEDPLALEAGEDSLSSSSSDRLREPLISSVQNSALSTRGQQSLQQQHQSSSSLQLSTNSSSSLTMTSSTPTPSYRDFAIMGALDSMATMMQVYAAVYLPGPLLILLPQAAIPLSFLVLASPCYSKRHTTNTNSNHQPQRQEQAQEEHREPSENRKYQWTQYLGAAAVVLGIIILMEPLLTSRRSPDFYCEAVDLDSDCTICQMENSRESCLAHLVIDDDDRPKSVGADTALMWRRAAEIQQDDQFTPTNSLCQWLPFEEATRQDEILTFIWSLVLIASCIPMTLSTFYKEWALGDADTSRTTSLEESDRTNGTTATTPETDLNDERLQSMQQQQSQRDPIYLNGWIAVFQLFFAVPLCVLGGLVSSPMVPPEEILPNLWHGFQCYFRGIGSITSSCHPDELCGTFSFWLVNFHLFTTLGYSYFMLYCLKHGTTTLFFLALTVMVPLGTTAFVLPFMPQAVTPCLSDCFGSAVIVLGLILYRFFDNTTSIAPESIEEEEEEEEEAPSEPIARAFFALQRDLSSCLLSEPLLSGDV